ncbi:ubiquitin C-terminal hydrolase Ubp14 [Entomophthora muscae]|uniref:Ubiquitin C-terminal hydrolase Ubp14 n=1 Tax=Entomophthora muscae TaxID=34485 RepID=A0ACC2TT82_9FUNG|nr:ubiquitin C-terminal hydrolase Ubp14 [Entomophthora muscae]
MTKLAIPGEESEEEKYQIHYQPHCLTCNKDLSPENNPKLADIIRNIESASSALHKSNVQAWEEARTSCEHVLCAEQFPDLKPVSNEVKCEGCDLKNNLWLCFTCGALGCGRRQYDGSGGNGHGLAHFQNTGHKVSVKLGTITPEGDADVYCYGCDDERVDPELKEHLSKLGIHIHDQVKTEKSVTELQIEHNLLFDFNMTTEDGKQLTPLGGPGLTGLKNLGNSCYMASVVQALFVLPSFKERYLASADLHHLMCQENPLDCFHCQASKLAYGLYSGRYSQVQDEHQDGIPPTMFKRLVGKGHHEFSTMQQQDAFEYAGHLLNVMERYEKASGLSPSMANFQFKQEHRLECQGCSRARYSSDTTHTLSLPVPEAQSGSLEDCFAKFFEPELVEGYNCPQCKVPTVAVKTTRFLTYPKVLILNLRQFALVNWVPTKLEIPVAMPSNGDIKPLLEKYRAPLRADGELLLPDQPEGHPQEINQDLVNQMMSMGLSQAQCQRALRATGGSDVDAAVSWVFEHMDDPDVEELPASSSGPDPESIAMLVSMGFSETHAAQALRSTDSNMERAVEWIFSHPEGSTSDQPPSADAGVEDLSASYILKAFVSHKGTSTHCGHYVAHVNVPDQPAWVLFNDNKVAAQPEPPVENAYLYFFQRQDAM